MSNARAVRQTQQSSACISCIWTLHHGSLPVSDWWFVRGLRREDQLNSVFAAGKAGGMQQKAPSRSSGILSGTCNKPNAAPF